MKKIFLLLLFALLSISSQAQFRFGARISLVGNSLLYLHTSSKEHMPLDKFSASGGLVVNYKFNGKFSLQSELIYNRLGANFYQNTPYTSVDIYGNDVPNTAVNYMKISMQYLEVPLLAKFTFLENHKANLYILAGAFVGYKLAAKQETNDNKFHCPEDTRPMDFGGRVYGKVTEYPPQNVTSDYTTFNAGYSMGFGLSIMQQRMFFEMRGNRGLVNIDKTETTKVNTVQFQFTVGYYLFRGKKK